METLIRYPSYVGNHANSLIGECSVKANKGKINILSLDCAGKRTNFLLGSMTLSFVAIDVYGYMPIKILTELITQK